MAHAALVIPKPPFRGRPDGSGREPPCGDTDTIVHWLLLIVGIIPARCDN
jgi:hypothetical protein